MEKNDLQARALRASKICKSIGLTQKQLALAIGASQPQVSRILKGRGLRASRIFDEVCIYAENKIKKTSADAIISNSELMGALQETWDGTATHAKALAAVIRSLRLLASPEIKAQPKTKKVKSR